MMKKTAGNSAASDSARIEELERQLAHAIADARISAMIHERTMQRQHEQFQNEFNATVQQANAEFERLRARIAELEGAAVKA